MRWWWCCLFFSVLKKQTTFFSFCHPNPSFFCFSPPLRLQVRWPETTTPPSSPAARWWTSAATSSSSTSARRRRARRRRRGRSLAQPSAAPSRSRPMTWSETATANTMWHLETPFTSMAAKTAPCQSRKWWPSGQEGSEPWPLMVLTELFLQMEKKFLVFFIFIF